MTRKSYTGEQLVVSFDGTICEHAGECVRGLPQVFDTKRRPWIDLSEITTEEQADKVREVVGRCPSHALLIEEKQ